MWDQVGKLHAYHGDVPVEVRLLKLTEEAEVADAFLGVHGLNARGRLGGLRREACSRVSGVMRVAAGLLRTSAPGWLWSSRTGTTADAVNRAWHAFLRCFALEPIEEA